VHAFITSKVDYCNGLLLTGLPKKTMRQLQLIQKNAAASILSRTRKWRWTSLQNMKSEPYIYLILPISTPCWYKSFNGLGPQYIADMLTEYKPITQIIRITSARNTKGSLKAWRVCF